MSREKSQGLDFHYYFNSLVFFTRPKVNDSEWVTRFYCKPF